MLKTEERNPLTMHIDRMSTAEMMQAIQHENEVAVAAVGTQTAVIAEAVDRIAAGMARGGRLFYVGCGTSGRLGVQDAAECPPTFGIPQGVVIGIMAGGDGALRNAVEGVEDDPVRGRADLCAFGLTDADSVIGISAAGGAAYVCGALEAARAAGACTVALTSNPGTAITRLADLTIAPDTGAEVITGSTRMKAGSAQKMILNMISTGVMIKAGNVYENMMINLRPTNDKLRRRMIRIVDTMLSCGEEAAERLLEQGGWSIRRAAELAREDRS